MMTKLKLTSLLFIFPLLLFSQIHNIDAGIYRVVYDENLESPTEVSYTVLCPNGKASRKGMNFYKNDSIHTADNDDYKYNVWDKGHMAPAASFNCTEEMVHKTFSYLNSALQHKSLNRGEWKALEFYERSLASFDGPVDIIIVIEFDENPPRVPGGAAIPKGFYKKIKSKSKKFCFYFPNVKPNEEGTFDDYEVPCN